MYCCCFFSRDLVFEDDRNRIVRGSNSTCFPNVSNIIIVIIFAPFFIIKTTAVGTFTLILPTSSSHLLSLIALTHEIIQIQSGVVTNCWSSIGCCVTVPKAQFNFFLSSPLRPAFISSALSLILALFKSFCT